MTEQLTKTYSMLALRPTPAIESLNESKVVYYDGVANQASQSFTSTPLPAGGAHRYDYARGYLELPYSATFTRGGWLLNTTTAVPEYIPDALALPPPGYVSHVLNCVINDSKGATYTNSAVSSSAAAELAVSSYWLALLKDSRDVFLANCSMSGRARCSPREEMEGHVSGTLTTTAGGELSTTWNTSTRNCFVTSGLDPKVGGAARPFYGRRAINRGLFERLIGSAYPLAAMASDKNLPSWSASTNAAAVADAAANYTITLNYTAFVPLRDLCDVFRGMPPTWRGMTFLVQLVSSTLSTMGISHLEGPGAAAVVVQGSSVFPLKLTDRVTNSVHANPDTSYIAANGANAAKRISINVAPQSGGAFSAVGGKGLSLGGLTVKYGAVRATAIAAVPVATVAGDITYINTLGDTAQIHAGVGITGYRELVTTEAKIQDVTTAVSVTPHASEIPRLVIPVIAYNPIVLEQMNSKPCMWAYEQFARYVESPETTCGTEVNILLKSGALRASRLLIIPVRGNSSDVSGTIPVNRVWSHEPALPSVGYRISKFSIDGKPNLLSGVDAAVYGSSDLMRLSSSLGQYDAIDLASVLVVDLRDYADVMRSADIRVKFTVDCSLPGASGVAMYRAQCYMFEEIEVVFDDRGAPAVSAAPAASSRIG